ncbi:AraC family transcriptional regulator Rsp [Staphylococcus aureus]|uniref:AraC family transcriptional regulator Rsp n=1 Tax=Staphylococcus aureus TaxID=1280 RepID=UPI001F229F7F|nr:AraC family transcriptional regulator Rsp [Staphylococcus aureus]HDX8203775.1 AraC family transcriptional regulator Rsp [Staphylococcus aureus W85305]MCF0270787.1 AraC family transcriptional regulator Rsp [Staphylococcus aureus]MCF0278383.1 AraC family transcriptional regulator Rsp [Staphylococcus aureus]MCF0281086.1 AraC family transcriptional regulator Rsp [Staphylococcus aureus]MCF0288851.1 AraC family transcriptional regulator Rsp [Staphylococcus aureus]
MTCQLKIHHTLSTIPSRNINNIMVLFSLTSKLNITINGETKDVSNYIILINHGDIYNINHGENIIELMIPVFYFYQQDDDFFNGYLDRHLLQSSNYIKSLIADLISTPTSSSLMGKNIGQSIIDTLLKEAFIRIDHEYLPNIALSNPVFIDCVNYIHDNIDAHLSLKDIAMHCNISESYCSNLFVRYLSMNFKDYFTSIKLVNAINLLLSTKHSITTVSELAGFNSHTNFANQFKNYLHFSPKQFRSLVSKITEPPQIHFQQDNVSQFTELISTIDLTAQLATNTTDIHIDDFNPKDRSQRAKVFVRFSNFNELFQFIFNEYYDINFEHLPKPVVFIDDIHDIEISQTNYNLLNRCFEKLFEKNIGLAIAIKSTQQFETMKQLILTFLQGNQDYKTSKKLVKFMLVFCSNSMTAEEIHLCHLKIKNKNKKIKYSVTVDGFLETYSTVEQVYDVMQRLKFHYYFIDIENSKTATHLITKNQHYHQTDTHFEQYKKFILDSGISSTQFVYNNLSVSGFKYTNDGKNPIQLSDIVYHLIALLRYGGGISYQLLDDHSNYISLYNKYGSPLPLMHLYKMFRPFVNEDIEITNNYVLSRKDNNYHFLLFNKINDRYMSDVKQDFIFHNELPQDSLMIIKTLNHEHGSIQHLLPISDQLVYIEKEILDELDKTNYPKTELAVQEETGRTFELKLNHDEVKYICFKPS